MNVTSTHPAPASQLKTILIIDDDVHLAAMLALGLEANGYHTVCAANATVGWSLARAHLPDLVLSDIELPGKDGRRLLEEMRADPELGGRQFVLMSGKPAFANPRAAMNLGADDFLLKPFELAELLRCVAARLQRARLSRRIDDRGAESLRQSLHPILPHEFLGPLTGIIGLSELLGKDLDILNQEEIRRELREIHQCGRLLHRSLRNYLWILAFDSEQVAAAPQVLAAETVAGALADGISAAAHRHERSADLVVNLMPAPVRAGREHLCFFLEELVDNALCFSRRATPVSVRVWPAGDGLRVTVTDTGRGMTAQQLERLEGIAQHRRAIFEPKGPGLGLILVRRIVQHLGGEFRIESDDGTGTTCHVTLPLALG